MIPTGETVPSGVVREFDLSEAFAVLGVEDPTDLHGESKPPKSWAAR